MTSLILPENILHVPTPKLAGYYKLEAKKFSKSGKLVYNRLVADWFPNLITDAGLNGIGTLPIIFIYGGTLCSVCKVGTDNTTPAVTDTALLGFVGASSSVIDFAISAVGSPLYYRYGRNVYRFGVGVAAGNLSEIGVGIGAANTGILFSRALILDGGGSPTTITILADEVLDATYEMRAYPSLVDVASMVTISSVTYDVVCRTAGAGSAGAVGVNYSLASMEFSGGTNALGAITVAGNGDIPTETTTVAAYVDGSLQRDVTSHWGLTYGSATMNTFFLHANIQDYQFGFTPGIPKTNSKVLDMTARFGPWSRY